jgi:hypothetical protein
LFTCSQDLTDKYKQAVNNGAHAVPFIYATIVVNSEKLLQKTRQHAENLTVGSEAQTTRFDLVDEFEEGVEQLAVAARGMFVSLFLLLPPSNLNFTLLLTPLPPSLWLSLIDLLPPDPFLLPLLTL